MRTAVLLLIATLCATQAVGEERADSEPSVTLRVQDVDVHLILREMQKQCGIRNLLIDPGVSGAGTLLFREVPCSQAFRTVLRQFGLAGQVSRTIVHVQRRD